ncbi:MAG TPA: biotin--[acetyl-CoA-carboxylase] ligase [Clostridiales bacterium]|nr:biotin--[acetyl-CoA-carboxylase] ligase [Clostridiales bacterium]
MKAKIQEILLKNQDSYVSGEEISRRLGISRTAVWKYINNLREEGFGIKSVPNKGYRLEKIPDRLDPVLLRHCLLTRKLGQAIEIHEAIDSTNTRAKELAQTGAPHGTLVAAEEQIKGRGRLGRSWESPPGTGIWMSLILRPSFPPRFAPRITVIAALAAVKAISSITGLDAAIKWPNDIIINYRKVCGILTEMQADPDLIEYAVLGMGINVNTESFPAELVNSATSLYLESGARTDRCRLLAGILGFFEGIYEKYEDTGDFTDILKEYKERCITLGQRVRVVSASGEFEGIAEGLTQDCELIVVSDNGMKHTVLSGDVSVRGICGYV